MTHPVAGSILPRLLWLSVVVLLLAACAGDPGQGPVEVAWGEAPCRRCNMILEDRLHAAQVRRHPANEPTQAYLFDDLGCALIWLQEQPWRDEPATEIWVSDHETGVWLDARKAHYATGDETPMYYGLGARAVPFDGALDFEAARQHVFTVEERLRHQPSH